MLLFRHEICLYRLADYLKLIGAEVSDKFRVIRRVPNVRFTKRAACYADDLVAIVAGTRRPIFDIHISPYGIDTLSAWPGRSGVATVSE